MVLTNEQLKQIHTGAYCFEETEDGYLHARQYSAQQRKYFEETDDFWFPRSKAGNAKTIEFVTSATEFSLDYKILWNGSDDSFELALDGLLSEIRYIKDIEREGTLSFSLPEGDKTVTLYLPVDAELVVGNFNINAPVTPVKKGEKVLWMGDSITQGYGPMRSGHTYVSVANRILGYDIINQGIGGYIYDKNVLMPMEGYTPDKIIIAMGTNQYGRDDAIEKTEEYYERLHEVYGDTPVLCITPIWRGDAPHSFDMLVSYRKKLTEICSKYPNIKVVDGFTLVPHLPEYFLDNLHPNSLGGEVYGRNLVEAIKKIGF